MSIPDTSISPDVGLETAYGLDSETLYNLAQTFLHEKAEKAFHLTFDNRIVLSALGFQVKYGKYETNKTADPGFFDFIGKRRIAQWQKLGDMTQEQAKAEYVRRIEHLCPLFRSYVEAYCRNNIDSGIASHANSDGCSPSSPPGSYSPSVVPSDEDALAFIKQHESDIRAALNSQTHDQFEQYALQQFPSDAAKRAELIAHLQERHFHEYTAYARKRYAFMHLQQQQQQQKQPRSTQDGPNHCSNSPSQTTPGSAVCFTAENADGPPSDGVSEEHNSFVSVQMSTTQPGATKFAYIPNGCAVTPPVVLPATTDSQPGSVSDPSCTDGTNSDEQDHSGSPALVQPASMWTRGEVPEFKTSLADSKDSVIRVGCGEVITVRVPAYPAGSSIVWEFATDDYDIGFGLYFEWDLNESKPTNIGTHTVPPEGDVDDPNTPATTTTPKDTVPAAGADHPVPPSSSPPDQPQPPLIDEIVPVYRRNSHQEIYCGSHLYPGLGTYLFKFDNSYSLWRSKTLYYRVYYTC